LRPERPPQTGTAARNVMQITRRRQARHRQHYRNPAPQDGFELATSLFEAKRAANSCRRVSAAHSRVKPRQAASSRADAIFWEISTPVDVMQITLTMRWPAPQRKAGQPPTTTTKTPRNGTHDDHGTVRPAQCPKTMCELGPGGCLLSVPKRKTSPAPRARSYLPTLQSSSHPREKVKVVGKQKSKSRSKVKTK
jgi:hypothetical protein